MIEIITTLVIVTIVMSMTALLVGPVLNQQSIAYNGAVTAQQCQQVFWRMHRDIATMTNVVSGTQTRLEYDSLDSDGNTLRRTIAWGGANQALTMDGNTWLPDVSEFRLQYLLKPGGVPRNSWSPETRMVDIYLNMGPPTARFGTQVFARNL